MRVAIPCCEHCVSFKTLATTSHTRSDTTMPSATASSSAEPKQVSASTSYLRRDHCRPPPLSFCSQINANIRANRTLDSPYFDLAGHIGNRAYCLHNVAYAGGSDETAALLDVGVKDLLPDLIPAPPVPPPKGLTFVVREGEGKHGLGMFAARNIPVGGLIAVERPILVAPYMIALQTHPESDFSTALLHRLSAETVERFMGLANCKPASECDIVEGIIRTNAIAITLNVPSSPHPELPTHRGIFPNISRCNHRYVVCTCSESSFETDIHYT